MINDRNKTIIVPNVYTASYAGLSPPIYTEPKIKKSKKLTNAPKKKILIYFDMEFLIDSIFLPNIIKFPHYPDAGITLLSSHPSHC